MNFIPPSEATVREYFQLSLLAELQTELRPATLKEIRTALKHWERSTSDPPIRQITSEHARQVRDTLLAAGLAPATVKKVWAHLTTIFRAAQYDDLIPAVPQAGRFRKSILPRALRQERSQQRRPVSWSELSRLFAACESATYPRRPDRVFIWRALLFLLWTYGPRTQDLLALTPANLSFGTRLFTFRALKTSKLQGLPLTDLGISILSRLMSSAEGRRLFQGFNKPGNWNNPRAGSPHWIAGFYATWNREICPAAGVIPSVGPDSLICEVSQRLDAVPPIQFKTFRQTMVTELNDFSKRVHSCRPLGAWVAGHYVPGVTAASYDFPEQDVREAIQIREQELLPDCFRSF